MRITCLWCRLGPPCLSLVYPFAENTYSLNCLLAKCSPNTKVIMKLPYSLTALLCWAILLLSACSPNRYIPDGEQLYTGIKEIKIEDKKNTRNADLAISELKTAVSYKPNYSLLGSSKYRLPLTYGFFFNERYQNDSTFLGRWLYKSLADKPKLVSMANPMGRAAVASQVLSEYGFFNNNVYAKVLPHGKDSLQAKVGYYVTMGNQYYYDSISYHIPIVTPDSTNLIAPKERLLHKGEPFTVTSLEAERMRISELLRNQGFYFFRPSNIVYKADTMMVPGAVQLRVQLSDKMLPEAYKPWRIGRITYNLYKDIATQPTDSLYYQGVLFRFHRDMPVRPSVLRPRIKIVQDSLYNIVNQNISTQLISRLNTFAYTDVNYSPSDSLPQHLDVTFTSQVDKPYYAELEANFRFKSNNQVGPGAALTVNKKNLFGGGEVLSVSVQSSYEWETNNGTEGNSWDINSYEFNLLNTLTIPRVLLPRLASKVFRYPADTRISISGGMINRGQFYRLGQFSGSLAYRFEPTEGIRHTFTPLRVVYNHLMRSTDRFEEVLTDNPALRLAFQNQFIPTFGYNFGYELTDPKGIHGLSMELGLSEAGNLLSLAYAQSKNKKPHHFLGAPYAQFLKGTLELRYSYRINKDIQLASRLFGGAIYSYGNMLVAPYTEQFYAGGANSIRGFNVRTLGPGSYAPKVFDRMSFLDRTGDIRFEGNIEYRQKVIGDLELATFLDAGNVWLLRNDPLRPGGNLTAARFLQDIALGSGLGFRYDFSYLVVRFDLGIALHAPHLSRERYFNTFKSNDWYAFHLAIGYPF